MPATSPSIVRTAYRADFAAGVRAMLPWLAGVVPFGLVIGVSVAQADIPTLAGWLTGPLIYGGSAQIATIEMLNEGARPGVIVATALIINLRLVLYSGVIAAHWRDAPRWWRALAAYLLIDPSFVVGMDRYERDCDRAGGNVHYLGGAVVLWAAWLIALGAGATLGAHLPDALRLELIIPLYLIGEVIGKLDDPRARRAIVTAAAVAVAAFAVPLHLGVMLAILAGLAAAITGGRRAR